MAASKGTPKKKVIKTNFNPNIKLDPSQVIDMRKQTIRNQRAKRRIQN